MIVCVYFTCIPMCGKIKGAAMCLYPVDIHVQLGSIRPHRHLFPKQVQRLISTSLMSWQHNTSIHTYSNCCRDKSSLYPAERWSIHTLYTYIHIHIHTYICNYTEFNCNIQSIEHNMDECGCDEFPMKYPNPICPLSLGTATTYLLTKQVLV